MTKVNQKEMDGIMTLLTMSRHILSCELCQQKQIEIMNHGNIPIPESISTDGGNCVSQNTKDMEGTPT